jgi:hypothetical protein
LEKHLNISLDITEIGDVLSFLSAGNRKLGLALKSHPFIFVGGFPAVNLAFDDMNEYTHSYLTLRLVWYTPCAVQFERWSRFFSIFSVGMWIFFALSLVLAVITVRCISNYGHKPHLLEFSSYSNIFSVTSNIIAVSLSVSVNTQPHSAPPKLFFFCWVCYSVAIRTIFQVYLTTFLIGPGYDEPINTLEKMLIPEKKFGFMGTYKHLFPDTSDHVDSATVKEAVECSAKPTCYKWAAEYRSI